MKKFLIVLFLSYPYLAFAENINTPNKGTIQKIYGYADYGEGDVILYFDTGVEECPTAVYLSPSSPGFNTVLSLAITAYTTKQNVFFGVRTHDIFPGGLAACRVISIRYEN